MAKILETLNAALREVGAAGSLPTADTERTRTPGAGLSVPSWIVAGVPDSTESAMCWMCDHPGSTRADYLDHIRDLIACCGWGIQGIERDGVHPPWAYTVGLTTAGKPELVATGMPLPRAGALLNDVAAHLLHAPAPAPGESVELEGGPVIQIVEVAEPTAHLEMAVELFGPKIRALQVVHADDRGHWPWECGYRGVRGGQPVLGQPRLRPVAQPGGSSAPGGSRRPAARRVTRRRPSRRG